MNIIRWSVPILSLALLVQPAHALESKRSGFGILADSSLSGYDDRGGIGGPTNIDAQLEVDNQVSEPYFRVPIRVFQSWFAKKKEINEKYGVRYGLNYTAVYLTASEGITDSSQTNAASGIIDIPVSWLLAGKESGNRSTLAFKFENRHNYSSTKVPPMFLGFETGSMLLPATKVNEFSFRFPELYWQQVLFASKLHFVVGKVDPTNYYTFHGLIHPFMNFFGYGASVSASANWPNQGFGVIASVLPTKKKDFYIMAGLHDAGGDPFKDGQVLYWGDNFFDGKFFKAVEVGFVPTFEERYFKKVSITYWHSDEYPGSAEGDGIAIASHWFFQEKWVPFLLAGFSDGNGANTLAKSIISTGLGRRFKSHDLVGFNLNWMRPPGTGLRDQYTAELYYRFYLTEHLELTPDLQYVKDPSLNPGVSSLWYFGLRSRFTL